MEIIWSAVIVGIILSLAFREHKKEKKDEEKPVKYKKNNYVDELVKR